MSKAREKMLAKKAAVEKPSGELSIRAGYMPVPFPVQFFERTGKLVAGYWGKTVPGFAQGFMPEAFHALRELANQDGMLPYTLGELPRVASLAQLAAKQWPQKPIERLRFFLENQLRVETVKGPAAVVHKFNKVRA